MDLVFRSKGAIRLGPPFRKRSGLPTTVPVSRRRSPSPEDGAADRINPVYDLLNLALIVMREPEPSTPEIDKLPSAN